MLVFSKHTPHTLNSDCLRSPNEIRPCHIMAKCCTWAVHIWQALTCPNITSHLNTFVVGFLFSFFVCWFSSFSGSNSNSACSEVPLKCRSSRLQIVNDSQKVTPNSFAQFDQYSPTVFSNLTLNHKADCPHTHKPPDRQQKVLYRWTLSLRFLLCFTFLWTFFMNSKQWASGANRVTIWALCLNCQIWSRFADFIEFKRLTQQSVLDRHILWMLQATLVYDFRTCCLWFKWSQTVNDWNSETVKQHRNINTPFIYLSVVLIDSSGFENALLKLPT